MAVLMIAEVQGQTQQGYDAMFAMLAEGLRQTPGFVLHTAHPTEGGWRIIEVWESKAQADRFFATHVAPNLPPGVRPKRALQQLHRLLGT